MTLKLILQEKTLIMYVLLMKERYMFAEFKFLQPKLPKIVEIIYPPMKHLNLASSICNSIKFI
jgi:hypothetical protein